MAKAKKAAPKKAVKKAAKKAAPKKAVKKAAPKKAARKPNNRIKTNGPLNFLCSVTNTLFNRKTY